MTQAPTETHTHKPMPAEEYVRRLRAIKASLLKQDTPPEEIDKVNRGWASELVREEKA